MPEYRNIRFCPVVDRNLLPTEVAVVLPQYESQFQFLIPIKNSLCNSCAYAEISCDPAVCVPQLVDGLKWALTIDEPKRGMGGVAKKIYRSYAAENAKLQDKVAYQYRNLADMILEDD